MTVFPCSGLSLSLPVVKQCKARQVQQYIAWQVCSRRGHPCEDKEKALACFVKCFICGLTANRKATSVKVIALWQVLEGLPDWRVFDYSVAGFFADTMLGSAHRHASAVAAAPHGKRHWHE